MAYKTVTTEVEVDVDIDIELFDTDDIVNELVQRLKRSTSSHKDCVTAKMQMEIRAALGDALFFVKRKETIEDVQKMEMLSEIWDRYTAAQLEQKLK